MADDPDARLFELLSQHGAAARLWGVAGERLGHPDGVKEYDAAMTAGLAAQEALVTEMLRLLGEARDRAAVAEARLIPTAPDHLEGFLYIALEDVDVDALVTKQHQERLAEQLAAALVGRLVVL